MNLCLQKVVKDDTWQSEGYTVNCYWWKFNYWLPFFFLNFSFSTDIFWPRATVRRKKNIEEPMLVIRHLCHCNDRQICSEYKMLNCCLLFSAILTLNTCPIWLWTLPIYFWHAVTSNCEGVLNYPNPLNLRRRNSSNIWLQWFVKATWNIFHLSTVCSTLIAGCPCKKLHPGCKWSSLS